MRRRCVKYVCVLIHTTLINKICAAYMGWIYYRVYECFFFFGCAHSLHFIIFYSYRSSHAVFRIICTCVYAKRKKNCASTAKTSQEEWDMRIWCVLGRLRATFYARARTLKGKRYLITCGESAAITFITYRQRRICLLCVGIP